MNKTIENQIISDNNHQFIYKFDENERKQFLQDIVNNHPVIMNENRPMAIYLNKIGLPKFYLHQHELDKIKLATFCSEYLNFSIAHEITDSLLKNYDYKNTDDNILKFLEFINEIADHNINISTLHELNDILKKTRDTYYENYCIYKKIGEHSDFINELPIPFLDIQYYLKKIKEIINNNSYFCILINYQDDISLHSIQAINSLVSSRINSDISIKIASDYNAWPTHYSLNGDLIQNVHDYTEINLDNNCSNYVKKLNYNF